MIKYILLLFVSCQYLNAQTLRSSMVMEIVTIKGHKKQIIHDFTSYWTFTPTKIQLLVDSPNGTISTNYKIIHKKANQYLCSSDSGQSNITIYLHKKHITFVRPKQTLTYLLCPMTFKNS